MRRRRAYWGRGTHPSLVVGKEIEKGTTEAVVHEAVFATTFAVAQDGEGRSRYKPEWREFAAAVLLTLPMLVGKAAFETEFHRCASNLITGAEDDVRGEEEGRRRDGAARGRGRRGAARRRGCRRPPLRGPGPGGS